MMQDIIDGNDYAEGRTLSKGGMMQEEDIINRRDDAEGGHYRRKGMM